LANKSELEIIKGNLPKSNICNYKFSFDDNSNYNKLALVDVKSISNVQADLYYVNQATDVASIRDLGYISKSYCESSNNCSSNVLGENVYYISNA